VASGRHAVAIDEKRILFAPTLWTNVAELNARQGMSAHDVNAPFQQKWFPGTHGSVGGGGPERGLSDNALAWVMAGAKKQGLQLNVGHTSRIYQIQPNFKASIENGPVSKNWLNSGPIGSLKAAALTAHRQGPVDVREVSAAARRRWATPAAELPEGAYRPKTLLAVARELDAATTSDQPIEYKGFLAEHVVAPGESLRKIAKKYYSDPSLSVAIAEANRGQIDDPDEIFAGMVLKIPVVGTDATNGENKPS
jgi:nucleoid-associated protein YgaU